MRLKVLILLMFAVLILAVYPVCADEPAQVKQGAYLGKMVPNIPLPVPVMVIVDNAKGARPQAGLEDASIVYECLVEGGVTRFLALYYEKFPGRVGPVRSVRPYFVQIAEEYHAVLVHVGSSPDGYAQLATLKVEHIDEIENQSLFWHDSLRTAPHNTYTVKSLPAFLLENQSMLKVVPYFLYETEGSAVNGSIPASEVVIRYWGNYVVSYKFEPQTKSYQRYIYDAPHLMEGDKKLYADNIIVQFTDVAVKDDEGRLNVRLTGSGKALLFKNGCAYPGIWTNSGGSKTTFLDLEGNEWGLNPGQTWVQIAPTTVKVEYK